jgi:hypothetical protein
MITQQCVMVHLTRGLYLGNGMFVGDVPADELRAYVGGPDFALPTYTQTIKPGYGQECEVGLGTKPLVFDRVEYQFPLPRDCPEIESMLRDQQVIFLAVG